MANRCPECGGVARHIVTDIFGRRYSQCITGLTTFGRLGEEISRVGNIVPCDTIIDQQGRKVTGTIAYKSEGNTRTLAVTEGKERR